MNFLSGRLLLRLRKSCNLLERGNEFALQVLIEWVSFLFVGNSAAQIPRLSVQALLQRLDVTDRLRLRVLRQRPRSRRRIGNILAARRERLR